MDQYKRLLVCGGRDFNCHQAMNYYLSMFKPEVIIHGDAQGADQLGDIYADQNNIAKEVYPADWNRYGKKAGFLRNTDVGRRQA